MKKLPTNKAAFVAQCAIVNSRKSRSTIRILRVSASGTAERLLGLVLSSFNSYAFDVNYTFNASFNS